MKRTIEGVIFDMDGVLLDNVDFHLEAFRLCGEEEGEPLTREQVYKVFGRKNEDMFPALLDRELDASEVERLASRKEEIYRDLIRPVIRQHVVAGLFPLLEKLEAAGLPLAVATSGPPENVAMVLEELDLEETFQSVITAREVDRGKPHPEVFLKASSGLRLSPQECVVFEDSPAGVRAAVAAACKCIALTTTHSEEELQELGPDRVIGNFDEMAFPDLMRL